MTSDWQMPRAGRACAGCNRAFEVGETFRALLYDAPAGYERRDYCASCTLPAEPAPLGTWKTQRPAATAKKAQAFDREAVYAFFLRLEDVDEPDKVQFRFVLALILWRKKVLKFQRTVEVPPREYWEFAASASGETHRVERPDLEESQLERLSTQVEQFLAGQVQDLETAPTGEERADA